MTDEYQIYFTSTSSASSQLVNIALDDIRVMTRDKCRYGTTVTAAPSTTPPITSVYGCDFQANKCDWKDDTKASKLEILIALTRNISIIIHTLLVVTSN